MDHVRTLLPSRKGANDSISAPRSDSTSSFIVEHSTRSIPRYGSDLRLSKKRLSFRNWHALLPISTPTLCKPISFISNVILLDAMKYVQLNYFILYICRLVRAQEVDDIFAGHDDKYKASGIASSTPRTDAGPSPMKTARTAPQTASWSGQQVGRRIIELFQ